MIDFPIFFPHRIFHSGFSKTTSVSGTFWENTQKIPAQGQKTFGKLNLSIASLSMA